MNTAGPLQEAHRLTFAAEAARAGAAAGAPGPDLLAAGDAAAQAWDRLGQPYARAWALLRAAEAAMDRGDRDGAADRLARAAPLADRLGADPLRERIGLLARRARFGLPSGPAGEQAPGIPGLTAREAEVLRLVAGGMTTREVAGALFLSERTVTNHLTHIFGKIGVANRSGATAYALRNHLA